MFIAALFIIARTWKQPRCPSADEWIRKRWYIYTMESYSAIKEMEVLGATWDLLNPKPWGYFPEIHFSRPSRWWFRCIFKFENDCFNILFSFQRLISFPKPQRMGCSTNTKKEPVYFHFVHWRNTISPKDTPMNLLPGSDDLLIFNAFHLASCLPLWDHMCLLSGPAARGLSICASKLTERLQQP